MADIERQRRHEALEEKRRRLEEMKRSREKKGVADSASAASAALSSRVEVDELVSALLKSGVNDGLSEKIAASAADTATQPPSSSTPTSGAAPVTRRVARLGTVKGVASVRQYPTTVETYDKDSQTDFEEAGLYQSSEGAAAADSTILTPVKLGHRRSRSVANNSAPLHVLQQQHSPSHASSLAEPFDGAGADGGRNSASEMNAATASHMKHAMSESEKAKVTSSERFLSFFEKTSRIVERSLQQPDGLCVDLLKDYRHDGGALSTSTSKHLSVISSLQEPLLRGRPVMDLHVSPHHPELFLACYGAAAESSSSGRGAEEPGAVCVWSLAFKAKPEFTFLAPSPVLTARFHEYDPYLIIGSCYSGQIVMWDMRLRGSAPCQQSSMAGRGHKHPVYSLFVYGAAAAHELVSVSTDGLLCTWDIGHLAEPTTHHMLAGGGADETFSMTICNMTHMARDGETDIIFGTGSGSIMRASLPFRSHDPIQYYADAHMGLVTALAAHPLSSSKQHADLLLTSSFDWTVKLWNLKASTKPLVEFSTQSYDYVCDVRWCPSSPSVFATITSGGHLAVWDTHRSITSHADLLKIAPSGPGAALNKCHWTADGRAILLGDSRGCISVCSVGDALTKHDDGAAQAGGLVGWKTRAVLAVGDAHK